MNEVACVEKQNKQKNFMVKDPHFEISLLINIFLLVKCLGEKSPCSGLFPACKGFGGGCDETPRLRFFVLFCFSSMEMSS